MAPYISPMFTDLYNTDILALSATLKNERLENPMGTSRKVSKLCGSWVEIDVNVEDGMVSAFALRVQACALGQASAAILQENIIGASLEELIEARDGLRAMLKEGSEPPPGRFERLALLKGVRDYPARHTSTILAFDAAVAAVEVADDRVFGVFKAHPDTKAKNKEILDFKWPDIIEKIENGEIDDQTIFAMTSVGLPEELPLEKRKELLGKFHELYMSYVKKLIAENSDREWTFDPEVTNSPLDE